jgi:hypothetical protein
MRTNEKRRRSEKCTPPYPLTHISWGCRRFRSQCSYDLLLQKPHNEDVTMFSEEQKERKLLLTLIPRGSRLRRCRSGCSSGRLLGDARRRLRPLLARFSSTVCLPDVPTRGARPTGVFLVLGTRPGVVTGLCGGSFLGWGAPPLGLRRSPRDARRADPGGSLGILLEALWGITMKSASLFAAVMLALHERQMSTFVRWAPNVS